MSTALLLACAVAGWWLGGLAVVAGMSRASVDGTRVPWPERAGLALLLGIGLAAWGQFVWSWAGGSIGRTFNVVWLTTAAGVLLWQSLRRPAPSESLSGRHAAPVDESNSTWVRLAIGLVAAIWCLMAVQTLLTPQRLWDERAIFGIKAIVLFEDGTIRSPTLHERDFVQGHPRYPLLLPLAEAWIYGWLGRVDDRWAKLVPPLLGLGLWLTFAGVLTRRLGAGPAWLWTLLLAATPALTTWDYGFLSAQADASVGCYHGASVLYLWDWLTGRHWSRTDPAPPPFPALGVAGLCGGLALWTKDEGIALALVDAAILTGLWLAVLVRRSASAARPSLKTALKAAARLYVPLLLIAAPWFLHRRTLPLTEEMGYFERLRPGALLAGLSAVPWIVQHLSWRMFREAAEWGLHWWGAVLGCLLHPRRAVTAPQALLWLDVLGGLAALTVAGMLAPIPPEEHIGGSAHRFLLQLTPVGVLLAASQFHAAADAAPAAAPEESS